MTNCYKCQVWLLDACGLLYRGQYGDGSNHPDSHLIFLTKWQWNKVLPRAQAADHILTAGFYHGAGG